MLETAKIHFFARVRRFFAGRKGAICSMVLFYSHFRGKVLLKIVNSVLNLNNYEFQLAKVRVSAANMYRFAGFALKTN